MKYRQDEMVFEFNHTWWFTNTGFCEHGRRVFYSLELGRQQHEDESECDTMITSKLSSRPEERVQFG